MSPTKKTRSSPRRGEIVWIQFDPQAGHEQAGHRPALVLSVDGFNEKGMAVVCPITSTVRGDSFEVGLPPGAPVTGVVLSDHVKSIDWKARRAKIIGAVDASVLEKVTARLKLLCGL